MIWPRIVGYRLRKLSKKCRDLYTTSGSVRRTILFVIKFVTCKFGYAVQHQKSIRKAPQTRDQIEAVLSEQPSDIPLIAIKVTGGIGDYIVIARYLRDLVSAVEPFKFDLYCNYQAPGKWIFSGVAGFRTCYSEFLFDHFFQKYPLALRINQYVIAHHETIDWVALKNHWRLINALQHIIRFRPKIELFIQHHPYMDGFLGQKAVYMNFNRANFLHGMSKIAYGGDRFEIATDTNAVRKFNLRSKSYITVHNGFDPGFVVTARRATKCYPYSEEVVRLVKQKFPDLIVVQVGTSTSIPIASADMNIVNKTSLSEVAGIIQSAYLHFDNEGGLVHLATALGVKCCVVFGPTSADYFAYQSNINIRPRFCGGCWWVNETWMDQCPRSFAEARCMTEHRPIDIAIAIGAYYSTKGNLDQHSSFDRVAAVQASRFQDIAERVDSQDLTSLQAIEVQPNSVSVVPADVAP